MLKKAKPLFLVFVFIMALGVSVFTPPVTHAQPANITLTEDDDYMYFDWDETSGSPVADYQIELFNGSDWFVWNDGVSAESSFNLDRSILKNTIGLNFPIRITTIFADTSTSTAVTATPYLGPYYGQSTQFTVGTPEEVNSEAERSAVGLDYWVDGNIGFFEREGEIYSVSANGPDTALVRKDDSSLLGSVIDANITVQNQEQANDHISGGPVYYDKANDRLYMFYHGEFHPGGDPALFYSYIGMAYSDDGGQTFEDMGQIITPDIAYGDPDRDDATEIGGGALVVKDNRMYVYFKEREDDNTHVKLSVASAELDDVLTAGALGNNTTWNKWDGDGYDAPAIGGTGAEILADYPDSYWMDAAYIQSLNKFVLVYSNGLNDQWTHMISTSDDGVNWSEPERLFGETTDEIRYISISSSDFTNQRNITGDSFYVYYTRSEIGGGSRWDDAWGERYLVTFDAPNADSDNDGVLDSQEELAPGGDGNGDSIPDKNQDNVATVQNSVTGETATLAASGDCAVINEYAVVNESSLDEQDDDYGYPVGLNDFSISCDTAGASATVTAYYDKTYNTDAWGVRKFSDAAFSAVSGATMGTAEVNGADVSTISYSLTDGGANDEDGAANAVIVDPAGPAVLGATSGGTDESEDEDDGALLADTGMSTVMVWLLAIGFVGGSALIYNRSRNPSSYKH